MKEEEEQKRLKSAKRDESNRIKEKLQDEMEIQRIAKIIRTGERTDKVKERQKSEEDAREAHGKMMMNQIYQSFSKAEEQKKRLLDEGRQRFMIEYLRAEESREALSRRERAKEYQGVKLDEKLDEKSFKLEKVSSERKLLVEQKKEVRKDFRRQKSLLCTEFEKERQEMENELREKTRKDFGRRKKLNKSCSIVLQKREFSFSPSPAETSFVGSYKEVPAKTKISQAAINNILKTMFSTKDSVYRGFESNYSTEKDYFSNLTEESFNMGIPVRLTQTTQSDEMSFRAMLKGDASFDMGLKSNKTPTKHSRTKSKSRESVQNSSTLKSAQTVEGLELEVKCERNRQMRTFLGLLELEMGNDLQSEVAFDASAKKIVKYTKGQDDELTALMRKINYMDLKESL